MGFGEGFGDFIAGIVVCAVVFIFILFMLDTRVMNHSIIEAQEYCVNNEGVESIQRNQLRYHIATCNNDATFKLKNSGEKDVLQD